MRRFVGLLGACAVVAVALAATPASAHSHSRTVISFGAVFAPTPYYYRPHYYAPYPAYYYAPPPPVIYAPPPPPVVYMPAPSPAPYCREFRGDATIDGRGQPYYGTACYEADGRWHIR